MGIFDIFKWRKENIGNSNITQKPTQYLQILQFNAEFAVLLGRDSFIARSDYKHLISAYQEVYKFFCSIINAHL